MLPLVYKRKKRLNNTPTKIYIFKRYKIIYEKQKCKMYQNLFYLYFLFIFQYKTETNKIKRNKNQNRKI